MMMIFQLVIAKIRAHTVMIFFFFFKKRTSRSHRWRQTVRIVFLMVDANSLGPSSSVISCCVHSDLLQKEQQSVKGPDSVSTAGTPMPKLKPKRNIVLQRIINQYTK
jgi:hypothetical protein